jgi:hypothetical protein
VNNKPNKVFSNMNQTMEPKPKELYEAPTVTDIDPVTVNGFAGGGSYEEPENPDGGE